MNYSFEKIKRKYISLGLKKSQNLYITSDFGKIIKKEFLTLEVVENHYRAIRDIIGPNGTIIVPTASLNLCNSNKIFDLYKTPSYMMGTFSELIRKKRHARRSFHPFWSVSSIGKQSNYFTKNIPKHAFGYDSIWTRLIKKNAFSLHVGIDPRHSISIIHYIELMCGVPYRSTKIFKQYFLRNGKKLKDEFYHFAITNRKKVVRDKNKKIFKNFRRNFKPKTLFFDRGKLTLFPLAAFYNITLKYLSNNPYGWTKKINKK